MDGHDDDTPHSHGLALLWFRMANGLQRHRRFQCARFLLMDSPPAFFVRLVSRRRGSRGVGRAANNEPRGELANQGAWYTPESESRK